MDGVVDQDPAAVPPGAGTGEGAGVVLPGADALLAPGRVVMMTTVGGAGPRSRPVTVFADPAGRSGRVSVLATLGTAKVRQVGLLPRATLRGPTPPPHRGWFSAEADVEVGAAPEVAPGAVRMGLRLTAVRVWTVLGEGPYDNRVDELPVA